MKGGELKAVIRSIRKFQVFCKHRTTTPTRFTIASRRATCERARTANYRIEPVRAELSPLSTLCESLPAFICFEYDAVKRCVSKKTTSTVLRCRLLAYTAAYSWPCRTCTRVRLALQCRAIQWRGIARWRAEASPRRRCELQQPLSFMHSTTKVWSGRWVATHSSCPSTDEVYVSGQEWLTSKTAATPYGTCAPSQGRTGSTYLFTVRLCRAVRLCARPAD